MSTSDASKAKRDPADQKELPSGFRLSPFNPEFQRDPHPSLRALREQCPVRRDPEFDHVLISGESFLRATVRDHGLGVDPRNSNPGDLVRQFAPDEDQEPSILFLDDPDHHRLRKLIAPDFSPRRAEARRPMVRELARRLVAAIEPDENGEFDLVEALTAPLPAIAIANILGVDAKDQAKFKEWSEISSAAFFTATPDEELRRAGEESSAALEKFFEREIAARRGKPADDLIGKLLHAQEDGDRFSQSEILTMCTLLLIAGNVTTSDLIGNGVRTLLAHPDQFADLREHPEKLRNAVEEMLRFDPPVTVTGRITPEDLELDGVRIGARESMTLLLSAANRDPALNPDPDRFDIDRADPQHHSFGGGAHFCLGAHLARIEGQEAVGALLERFPGLEAVPGGESWKQVPGFRGMSEFRVRTGS